MSLSLEEAEARLIESLDPDPQRAMTKFERCLRSTSESTGKTVEEVRSVFISPRGLSTYLGVKVSDLVNFNGKMVPRILPDVDLINADPEGYAQALHPVKLFDMVDLASFLYYNYGGGGLRDEAFDAIEHVLRKKNSTYIKPHEKSGAPPVERIRATLPSPMGSLEKVKLTDASVYAYLGDPGGMTWSVKLDGVTCLVVYRDGEVLSVYTGGDGKVGADVTYLKKYLPLPSPAGFTGYVRGELVISKTNFRTYSLIYSNPRSFVASRVNSGYITPGVNDLEFIAYELVASSSPSDPIGDVPAELERLTELGFAVPVHGTLVGQTVYALIDTYRTRRRESAYAIDGLVISTARGKRVAFKMLLDEQVRKSVLLDVEWNISRYGRLIPKGIYRAVYIDGTRQTKASLSNYRKVIDNNLTKYQPVEIVRSGDVIPMITSFGPPPPDQPRFVPPAEPKWVVSGSDAVLVDVEGNFDVAVQRTIHFVETLGVAGMGEITIRKLLGAMRNSASFVPSKVIGHLFAVPMKGFVTMFPGQGQKMRTNLHASLERARLDRLVAATSLVEGVGRKTIKSIITVHPLIFSYSEEQITLALKELKVHGIGPKKIPKIAKGIPALKEFLLSLDVEAATKAIAFNEELGKRIAANARSSQSKLYRVEVVFTKFLGNVDYDLEDVITDNAGVIGTEVSSSTTVVITGNPAAVTSKTIKASSLGKPVMTVREFRDAYLVPRGLSVS